MFHLFNSNFSNLLGIKYEIGGAIDSEALDLKPEQEIEKLKSKIETLGELNFLALFYF